MFENRTEHVSFLEEHNSMHFVKQLKLTRFLKKTHFTCSIVFIKCLWPYINAYRN